MNMIILLFYFQKTTTTNINNAVSVPTVSAPPTSSVNNIFGLSQSLDIMNTVGDFSMGVSPPHPPEVTPTHQMPHPPALPLVDIVMGSDPPPNQPPPTVPSAGEMTEDETAVNEVDVADCTTDHVSACTHYN